MNMASRNGGYRESKTSSAVTWLIQSVLGLGDKGFDTFFPTFVQRQFKDDSKKSRVSGLFCS